MSEETRQKGGAGEADQVGAPQGGKCSCVANPDSPRLKERAGEVSYYSSFSVEDQTEKELGALGREGKAGPTVGRSWELGLGP